MEVFLCFFLLMFVHAFLILIKKKTTLWTFSLNPHFVLRLCKHWHWTLGVISCVWESLCSEICCLLCSLQADISAHVSYHAEAQGSVVVGEPVPAVAHVPDGRGSWHGGESAHLCAPASAAMREWKRCLTRYTRTGAVHVNKKLTQRKCYAPNCVVYIDDLCCVICRFSRRSVYMVSTWCNHDEGSSVFSALFVVVSLINYWSFEGFYLAHLLI